MGKERFIGILTGVGILALMAGAIVLIANNTKITNYSDFTYENIETLVEKTDYDGIDADSINPASAVTGDLPERIIGSADAPVIIYEYADFSCSHCSEINTYIKKLVEQYDGKVAVVYRGFLLKGFHNNVVAASAAGAAAIQGYWEKYKNLVFSDQVTWYYLTDSEKIMNYFGNLFVEASDGQGDLDKFYEDMQSKAVAEKIAYDFAMGTKVDITATPTFRINGEKVPANELITKIDELLAK